MSRIDDLICDLCPDGVEYKSLSELVDIFSGHAFNSTHFNQTKTGLPLIRIRDINSGFSETYYSGPYQNQYVTNNGDLLIGMDGDFRIVCWNQGEALLNQRVCRLQNIDPTLDKRFLFHIMTPVLSKIQYGNTKSTVNHLSVKQLRSAQIPLPPFEIQQEIAKTLDQFTQLEAELEAELEVRRQQYNHHLNHFFTSNANTHMRTLRDVGPVRMCKRIMKNQTSHQGDIPFYKIRTFGGTADAYISRELYNEYKEQYHFPKLGSILISAAGTIGRAVPYDGKDAYFQDSNIVWIENDETLVLNRYLFYFYKVANWKTDDGTIKRLYNDRLLNTSIPIPPLSEQHRIVDCLDKFDTLVNDPSSGLPAEIEARRKQYEYYRDRLLTFPEKK